MIKRGKKGQVTLFIIIAIVIIAVVAVGVIFWPRISGVFMSQQQTDSFLASQSEPLRDSVYDCVESVSEEIFETIGLQAGYYTWYHLYAIDQAGTKVVVMFKDDNSVRVNKLPSLNMIAQEYEDALETDGYDKIDTCLNDFSSFKRKMTVEPQERKITAEIRDDNILINIDWPIKISKATIRGDASQVVEQKDVLLLIPLGKIWQVANDIVNSEVQQKPFADLVFQQYVTSNYNTLLKYITIDGPIHGPEYDVITFLLTTQPYREGEKEFKFYFACDRR